MLKFHHKLLLLLWTVTVVSFILLGIIVTHVVTQVVFDSQERELAHESEHYVDLFKHCKKDQLKNIIENKALTVSIYKHGQEVFTEKGKVATNPNITEEANPTHFIYDQHQGKHRFTSLNHSGNYRVIISGVDDKVHDLRIQIWKYLALIGVVVMILLYLIVRYIHRSYIRPINDVTYATSLLVEGHYHIRIPESNVKETKALFVTTNKLARQLQRLNHAQKLQAHRLTTTIENIPSSILMINNRGEVVVVNQSYYHNFKPTASLKGERYSTCLNPKLQQYVAESFKTEKPMYEQINLQLTEVHDKYFDMACVPVHSSNQKYLYGIIVVLHDITQLKKLENLRREFVANVSHELKTPITSIKGFSETLLDGATQDTDSLEMFLNIIHKESERIESLVSDLLDLSHIEQQASLTTERLNLSELTLEAVLNLKHLASEKAIQIIDDIDEDIFVNGHRDKLMQVIVNLISNAISYSTAESQIQVRLTRLAHQCLLEVEDQGMGIAPEDQSRIFERFYRVDKARSRDSGGTGLGLSITKHIIEAHEGQIEVDSELGIGSTFKVTLDLSE